MDQPLVFLKVAGRTCIGQIVAEREKWGGRWVLVEPIIGFAIDKWTLISDVQFMW
jgi:hypothetical protein